MRPLHRSLATATLLAMTLSIACANSLEGEVAWQIDHQEPEGAVLSVWGTASDDVWAVGGQADQGLILHNDGATWSAIPSRPDQLLWWVYGFSADDVYAVGEGGLILHFDGSEWTEIPVSTDVTLYGVWGATGDDVWIVGGRPFGAKGSAVVLRGDSRGFQLVDDIPADLLPRSLYKIYGGPQGIIAVGSSGTVLRYEEDAWRRELVPTEETIFSLWGRADDDLYAVATGEVLHFDGSQWAQVGTGLEGRALSGVFAAPGQPMIAVGNDAFVLELAPDGTQIEPQVPIDAMVPTLHGVWGDGHGSVYAVGGDLIDPDAMTGVIYKRQVAQD